LKIIGLRLFFFCRRAAKLNFNINNYSKILKGLFMIQIRRMIQRKQMLFMKNEELVWEDFEDIEDNDREISFEFEMDFGHDRDKEFYPGSDLEYDL
jgi:hypothetical protein